MRVEHNKTLEKLRAKAKILWKEGLLSSPDDLDRVEDRWKLYTNTTQKTFKELKGSKND